MKLFRFVTETSPHSRPERRGGGAVVCFCACGHQGQWDRVESGSRSGSHLSDSARPSVPPASCLHGRVGEGAHGSCSGFLMLLTCASSLGLVCRRLCCGPEFWCLAEAHLVHVGWVPARDCVMGQTIQKEPVGEQRLHLTFPRVLIIRFTFLFLYFAQRKIII